MSRRVRQAAVVQHHSAEVEIPTWQRWAGSDRPEDVLAKLDAIRDEIMSGKEMTEDSTTIIRAARESRGEDV